VRLVHPPLHDASQTSVGVNAFVVVVPDHLQPRRLTTLLSNLRPSGPLASIVQSHFTSLSSSDGREPVFPSYSLTLPQATFFSIWPSHSFEPPQLSLTLYSFLRSGLHPRWQHLGTFVLRTLFLLSWYQASSVCRTFPAVVVQRYSLDTFFQLQAALSAVHVSISVQIIPLLAMTAGTTTSRGQTWGGRRIKAHDDGLPIWLLTACR
jgi:hypothetical protein